ncbi:MAG: hypothetical protein ACRBDI_03830 [Alphaproteobacteria bacterium]
MKTHPKLKSVLRRLSLACCLTILFIPYVTYAQSNDLSKIIERPDEDLLIFSLDLGKMRLSETLLVYEDLDTGKYYVPLSDFVDALEFPIRVDDDYFTAQGWFLTESTEFSLDLRQATAISAGKEFELTPEDIERHEDGIYVSLKMLEKWFPVTLDVDFSDLRLVVKSLEPLPIELRIEREKKRDDISKYKSNGRKKYELAEEKTPLFTTPIINVSSQGVYDNSDIAQRRIIKSGAALASAVVAGQDFLMSVNDSTSNGQGPEIRTHIGLQDLDGNLFGVGGSEYKLGDIYSNSLPYISSSASGRGAYFSTFPLNYSDAGQSGTTRLRGELLVGYQVDVMRNGQLLGFLETPDENGEYIFDLDVLPGLNVFELVFYGPQGQKEVQEERIFVPLNAANKGDFNYKMSVLENNRNLITNYGSSTDPDFSKHRIAAEAQYGLSDLSSVYMALSDVTMDGERQRYGTLRYSRSFGSVRSDWTYAKSFKEGDVLGARLQTVFKGMSMQLEHSTYRNDFVSEETEKAEISGILRHDTEFRASGALPFLRSVPFTLNVQRLTNTVGDDRVAWNIRATKNIRKLRVSADVSQKFEEMKERETDLSFQVSSRINKLNLRGGASFDIEPEYALQNISFLADWQASPRGSVRFGLERSGVGEDVVHDLTLGGSYKFDPAIIGLSFNYTDENDLRAILSTSFSLGYDPLNKTILMSNERRTETAMFLPHVYYDKNNNGVFDDGDEWMENVGFDGRGFDKNIKTNKGGRALLTGIDGYERSTLKINEGTLPDPFLRPKDDPQDYILRSGQIVRKDMGVVLVGEVDGEVMLAQNGKNEAAQSFLVDLVSISDPSKTYQGKTEYDGFIWMQEIPMGRYRASLNLTQLDELGYCSAQTQEVVLENEEPMATLNNFTIWPKITGENVNLVLGRGSIESLEERWAVLNPVLEGIFFDLNTYPSSYILHGKDAGQGGLVLYDIAPSTANDICGRLSDTGAACEVYEIKENYCPRGFVKIDQITQDIMAQNDIGSGDTSMDDLINENELKDMTEEDILEVIDN